MDTNKHEFDPKISVILPVYNAELYLKECLESLKAQTFRDFEVLLFDDASTDRSHGILMAFDDPRFHVERSRQNQGYAVYLNRGIENARGKYIARMDADDLCHPERFQKQVDFLESHPEVGICGTGYEVFGSVESKIFYKPESDEAIRWMLMLDNPFQHPTVMMRRSVLIDHALRYREDLTPTEDYELWSRLMKVTKGVNLQESLLRYRFHAGQETSGRRERQLAIHEEVAAQNVKAFYEIQGMEMNLDVKWGMRFRMGSLKKGESGLNQIINYHDFLGIYFQRITAIDIKLKNEEFKILIKFLIQVERNWFLILGLIVFRPSTIGLILKRIYLNYKKIWKKY